MGGSSEWAEILEEAEELTPRAVEAILSEHGDRGRRAIEGVAEDRVKQYRDFTIVVGHRDEYIVEADTCTCEDMRFNLDDEDPTARCWHHLAVEIAAHLGAVEHHDLWYSDVTELI